MNEEFTQTANRLISEVCDAIPFATDDDFNVIIDDCVDAMEGKPFPHHYSTAGFAFPELPEDGYYPMMALHYLMELVDERKLSVPDELRKRVEEFFSSNGIKFEWDKTRFIMDSFYPVEKDRIADLKEYKEELREELRKAPEDRKNKIREKIFLLDRAISSIAPKTTETEEKQTGLEKLKMLIVLNNGKDFTKEQLAAFDGISPEDEKDGADSEEDEDDETDGGREVEATKLAGQDHWTDQYDENPDEYNA